MNLRGRKVLTHGAIIAIVLLAGALVAQESAPVPVVGWTAERRESPERIDVELVEGLRRRGLFDLASHHVERRLQESAADSKLRLAMAIERVWTAVERAASLPPLERPPAWKSARDIAAKTSTSEARHPQAIRLRIVEALVLFHQGDQLRREAEVGLGDPTALETARAALHDAARALDGIRRELDASVLEAKRRGDEKPTKIKTDPGRAAPFTAEEWGELQRDVVLRLAQARRALAECHERGSDDRSAMLVSALDVLNQAIDKSGDDAWTSLALVERMSCYRAGGKRDELVETFALVDRDIVDPLVRALAAAQVALVALEAGDLAQARATIARIAPFVGANAPPEFDDALLALTVAEAAAASQAGRVDEASAAQREAVALTRRIAAKHGAYWGRRADQRAAGSITSGAGEQEAELSARLADTLVVKRDYASAIKAYDGAADATGDDAKRFQWKWLAALCQEKLSRHDLAAERFRQVSLASPKHPQAALAHLAAARNAAQVVRVDPAMADWYVELLREQTTHWPDGESADQARLWLAQWLLAQQDESAALDALESVSLTGPHGAAATQLLTTMARAALGADAAKQRVSSSRWIALLRTAMKSEVAPDARRDAALALAETLIASGDADAAETILRDSLKSGGDGAPATWRAEAQSLRVVALAAQPAKRSQAVEALRAASAASTEALLAMTRRLAPLMRRGSGETRREVAKLQLEAIKLLQGAALDDERRDEAALFEAEALRVAGRRDEALSKLETLARRYPDRGDVQELYAEALLDSADLAQLKTALETWRRIVQLSRPRSERWLRAKHRVALALLLSGDKEGAKRLARYMLETPPGLQGEPIEAEFCELLKRCE